MDNTLSRRSFFRMAAAASALAGMGEPLLARAQRINAAHQYSKNSVRIDSNENPLGPCSGACAEIASLIPEGGRYDFILDERLVKTFSEMEGLKPGYVANYAGSTVPLNFAVLAYTSKARSYVTADPGYEAGMHAAEVNGARVIKVPLASDYSHDVKAMVAADPNAGLLYICSPNNPTGTVTRREQIEYALANKPKGSIVLLDEAYIHFSDATPSIDLVKADKDLIVLRTFSKIYGMAGLRCGLAIGRPDLLEKLQFFGANFNPIMGTSSAIASLNDPDLVPARKKINADIRNETFAWLEVNNYKFIPSQSNCFLLNAGRPGREVMAAMAQRDIYIGRVWPIMPDWVRITVGSRTDMTRFQAAWKEVMNSSTAELTLPENLRLRSELPFRA